MNKNTNNRSDLYALYMVRCVKQQFDNIQLCFITLKREQMRRIVIAFLLLLIGIRSSAQSPVITGSPSVCNGSVSSLSGSPAGGIWSSSLPTVATIDPTGNVTALNPGQTIISYTNGTTATLTLTVNAAPAPILGSTSLCAGNSTTLTNTTSGGIWGSSSPGIVTVGSSSGVATGLTAGVTTIYYTLSSGCSVSKPFTVNLTPSAISGASRVCVGAGTLLTNASPGGVWSSSNPAVATVGSTGTVSGVYSGSCAISYSVGTGCFTTKAITVNPIPYTYSLTGGGSYCAGGTGVPINLSGSQNGISYQLYFGGFPVGSAVPGTGTALSFGLFTSVGAYTLLATNTITGCARTIGSVSVTTNALPLAYNVTGGGGYCPGGTGVHANLGMSQSGVTYQLFANGTPTGAPVNGSGISIDFGAQTTAGIYTVVGTNTITGCSKSMNGSANVSIYPLPNTFSVTGPTTAVCSGGTGFHIGLSGSVTGVQYQVYLGTVAAGAAMIGSGSPVDFGLFTAAGTYSVKATDPITTCSSNMTGPVTATINPLPTMYAITGGGSYCSGTTPPHIGLGNSDLGVQYQLFNGTISYGSPITGLGSTIDFGVCTYSGTYTVVATNTITHCTQNMTGSTTVTVNPLPLVHTVSSSGSSFCAGGTGIDIRLSTSETGISYQLKNGSTPIGFPYPGTGAMLDFGYQVSGGGYTVEATNTANGCRNTMTGTIPVTVIPAPIVFSVTGGGNYCTGGAGVSIGLGNSQTGVNYKLYKDTSFVYILSGTGALLDYGHRTAAGTYTIKATNISNGCASTMAGTAIIYVNPLPGLYTVTGGGNYCSGGAGVHVGLTGSAVGVNYTLYRGGVVVGSVVAGTGSAIDFGLQTVAGVYTVVATYPLSGCTSNMIGSATVGINALPTVFSVTGGGNYCAGGVGVHIGLSGSVPGISYILNSGVSAVDTIPGSGGVLDFGLRTGTGIYNVTARNDGTGCIQSMTGGANVSITATVSPVVSVSIGPNDTVCSGTTVTYNATAVNGGTSPSYVWTVNGVTTGTGITYSYVPNNRDIVTVNMSSSVLCAMPAMVASSTTMTVLPEPSITGDTMICMGSSTHLTGTPGGVWATSNPSVAVVASIGPATGVLMGVAAGISTISYSLQGCLTVRMVTVNSLPTVSVSSLPVGCGGNTAITASGASTYSWLPLAGINCPGCSSVVAHPMVTTTYTVTGTDINGCGGTALVTIDGNRISGYISYIGTSTDVFKVWLIQFNSSDSSIIATDSVLSCMDGGMPYYEFMDKPAGDYLVKAKLLGGVPGSSGYIPTYSLSTPYWYMATGRFHANATDTMHINMVYGTVPPGPGFIGGLISSGAGKGTSGDVPSPGVVVYLKDAVSNIILTYTYTDIDGKYFFSNLAEGDYIVFPEAFSFNTIPSRAVSLAGSADSVRGVDFKQYTNSRVITPIAVSGVTGVTANGKIDIYPNPTSGVVHISWSELSTGSATIVVNDVVGHSVYNGSIDISNQSGETKIDLSQLTHGVYVVSMKSGEVMYTWRLVVE
jgi:Secretion system C-terminal sorting domain/Bacterial Ig-like domain (group 2)